MVSRLWHPACTCTAAVMPTIDTKYFGAMPFDKESCFEFPWGLPAFEEERSFLPLTIPDHQPLFFLQSTTTPSLCFIALPVLVADPEYKLEASPEDLQALGLTTSRQPDAGTEVLVLTLLSIHENAPATANLLAPVVINLANRRALQAIRNDSEYSHEHPLAERTEACPC
jgi:flagellar assembly factor FliW